MRITKNRLKEIIKEEAQKLREVAQFKGGPEVDIKDAINMLEGEEDTSGTLDKVINRLYEALAKLGVDDNESPDEETLELARELGLDPADYPGDGELEFEINKKMA